MKISITLLALIISITSYAQNVGINNTNPHPSARLEISSTNSGLLIPRLGLAQRNAIAAPAKGLMVYDTTHSAFFYYDGGKWRPVYEKNWDSTTANYFNVDGASINLPSSTTNASASIAANVNSGFIYDNGGPSLGYMINAYSFAQINMDDSTLAIQLTVEEMNAEINDSLFIIQQDVEGAGFSDTLARFTGNQTGTVTTHRAVKIVFRANFSVQASGFKIRWGKIKSSGVLQQPPPLYGWYFDNKKIAMVGGTYNQNWQTDSLGLGSFSYGLNNKVKGNTATAFGNNTTALGDYSTALGNGSVASGSASLAAGNLTEASANNAFAAGVKSKAKGYAAIAMGDSSIATGDFSFAVGLQDSANGRYSTAIGYNNIASREGAVAIGTSNIVKTANSYAIGQSNNIPNSISQYNVAIGQGNNIVGQNTVSIGHLNSVTGDYSYNIGRNNHITANYAVALGNSLDVNGESAIAIGHNVTASGDSSVALGFNANTNDHKGAFVFSSGDVSPLTASVDNRFYCKFPGGYTFLTNAGTLSTGVFMNAGGNAWLTISNSKLKENFEETNGEVVLQKLRNIPLGSWNYIGQNPTNFRHYGIMAQDFFTAFGKDNYGTIGNDTTVNPIDMQGIAFSAIQALEQRTAEMKTENEKLLMMVLQLRKELEEIKNKK